MAEIKAVLFDMDGVLIDARDWHYEALNMALSPFGIEIGRESHLSTFDGLSTRQKLGILSRSHAIPEKLHGFLNELKQNYTQELIATRCRPVFQHRYLLSRLKREGYRLAMCSNSVRLSVDVMAKNAGLSEFLEFTLSNEDVNAPKPDPEMYNMAITRMGLNPCECLIVEDNENGILAARASGAHVMEVASPDDVTYSRIKTVLKDIAAEAVA
jgi:HAD superfamily hydrolase (TIGR01509 family)